MDTKQPIVKNPLCERLGIDVPIILAPMGGASTPRLAAAVSNAGGLGTLAPWAADVDTLRSQVREMRTLTSKPFAVNFVMAFEQEMRLDACLEEGVRVISFFWSDPPKLVERAKAGGAIVLHTVGSTREARIAVDCGVDIIVAQGWEAGGHVRGTVATLPLIPAVLDAVGSVPVVAAGGIGDARGLAAVLALGAAGAWMGTRFLSAEEAAIHPDYRAHLLAATENDTVMADDLYVVGGWPDAPHRTLLNSTASGWLAAGRPAIGQRPGETDRIGTSANGHPIRRYTGWTPGEAVAGDVEAMAMWAGQSVGQAKKVQPAAEIVRETYEGARAILRKLGS